ncbi:MAG: Nif3-like dinuclear metal center hexameric protein [Cytophagales bacterium]|jgi:dinuclear metal center YbgI/SA1388 family protein|nr:Nif3-like dinuclear metal center hexameric protein [Bacteroidota bacterium]MBS1980138.1 Nif3-like dinuclear metal center hexameric protein [Bacteroidota bacterium]WHZ08648.1 MAG: Nif3-like dinuclear metal center hexameric protein [Cytophagales bacterium]
MATTIKEVISHLENLAPLTYQEEYDNSGLLVGDASQMVTGVLVTLDCTEPIIDEAIQNHCNLIVAHHPIVFRGLKKLTGKNYVERTVIQAIKNDIVIYAIHTNLDNITTGVNHKIAERLNLKNCKILSPKKETLSKLVTFIPKENAGDVLNALHQAGAGHIGNYKYCSFRVEGEGVFMPTGTASPFIGQLNQLEKVNEIRAEVIFPKHLSPQVIAALLKTHPYEEVAYYLSDLENENQAVGSGLIGELEKEMKPITFLTQLKERMNTSCIRHTKPIKPTIKKIAVCGGAGSFLLPAAIAQQADVLVSADFKYHEFFDTDQKLMIADIGHYESEQFTKDLLVDVLKEKFTTFAIIFSKTVTNPISYL